MRLLAGLIVVMLLMGQGSAVAGELMLRDDPPKDTYWGYGLTFLVLSGASAAYSQTAAAESEDKLAKAKTLYDTAKGSGDSAAQEKATTALDDARSAEMRANAAAYMSLVFLLTSYFSFFPNHLPDNTVLMPTGIAYQIRF